MRQVYSLPWMVSFTGLNSNDNSVSAEELTTWKLWSHSIEITDRSDEQVKNALSPTVKMLLLHWIARPANGQIQVSG